MKHTRMMKMKTTWTLGVLAAVAVAASPVTAQETGSIKGTVVLKGEKPAPQPLDMAADKICHAGHEAPVVAEKTQVGANGEVQWAFLYVAKGLGEDAEYPTPTIPVVLDQRGCTYHPHVWGIQVDQDLEIVNSDATLHNVHALPKDNKEFNLAMPIKDMKVTRQFKKDEKHVKFKCDVHPWMSSYGWVMKHPFHAVSNEKGEFEISGLPPGEYGVAIWHEAFKAKGKMVTVEAGKTAEIAFEMQNP